MSLEAHVLYADDRLVAVAKPPGLSLATPRRDPKGALPRLLSALPQDDVAELGLDADVTSLVHRLDVGTSGLVILARSQQAHRDLVATISGRRADKRYLALVWGHPRPATGYIGLQNHDPGDVVWFKEISVRPLPGAPRTK